MIGQSGRTQVTRYFVQPDLLRSMAFPAVITLKRIEDVSGQRSPVRRP